MTTEEFVDLMIKWGNFKARHKSKFAKTEEAKKNEELRDKHKGQRCFILGNGPSIKEQDLSLLADEVVFVVNGFYKYEKYYDAKPDYYVIVDPACFQEGIGMQLLSGIECIREYEHIPALFVPYEVRNVVRNDYQWERWANLYYIDVTMSFEDGYTKEWDITKPVMGVQCVVQTAALLATYMGFKEIYLLGIEQTDIIASIERYRNKYSNPYAYEQTEEELKNIGPQIVNLEPLESMLKGYTNIFHLYKEVYLYCQKQGADLYNCTPASLVDSIPKKEYESLFRHGKQ